MYLKDLLQWGVEKLKIANDPTPRLDAEVLLAHAVKKDRLCLYLDLQEAMDAEIESYYKALIGKRSECMPVSYITGHKEFMSLDFVVNEHVLIPRPETEILVETVCKFGNPKNRVLELGTGGGAIAVSLAKYNPDWSIIATDLSIEALLVARENARLHEVTDRISFLQADLFNAFSLRNDFDWVVSNPPYIPAKDLAELPIGVRKYEPVLALDGGTDGLDVIRSIFCEAYNYLKLDGQMAIEIGYNQGVKAQDIASKTGRYSDYSIINDYSGTPRVFYCQRVQIGSM